MPDKGHVVYGPGSQSKVRAENKSFDRLRAASLILSIRCPPRHSATHACGVATNPRRRCQPLDDKRSYALRCSLSYTWALYFTLSVTAILAVAQQRGWFGQALVWQAPLLLDFTLSLSVDESCSRGRFGRPLCLYPLSRALLCAEKLRETSESFPGTLQRRALVRMISK